jgi:hypothetical protein
MRIEFALHTTDLDADEDVERAMLLTFIQTATKRTMG